MRTAPSAGTWSPDAQLEQVVEHDLLDRDLDARPVAHDPAPSARSSTASRSRVRFARYSCTMPMSAFADEHDPEQPVRR